MLYGGLAGELEVRAKGGSRVIAGSFPTGPKSKAVLSDGGRNGGRPKKEYFKEGAFKFSIEATDQDILVLVGHDFNRVMASKLSKTAKFWEDRAALHFEASLSEEILQTQYARDALAQIGAGLAGGVSVGFRVPPQRTVPDAERVFEEPPEEGTAIIRELSDVILYEISVVSVPAYKNSTVEARNWALQSTAPREINCTNARYRWRL
tara:strand:+ start:46034 stop:46654 length:621 start_codon:yes stop_codon:yes gene_type:complete